jgi:thiamine-phosphate pyrophosphorylase
MMMEDTPNGMLRIVDANLNRLGEGLRVLEELARLVLDDAALTQQLKNLRHDLGRMDRGMQTRLLGARDAASDVGREMKVPGEVSLRGVADTVAANARRAQESLRVLEELAKTGPGLDPDKFQKARFALYTIEKALVGRITRRDKMGRLHGLYVVVDTAALGGRDPVKVAGQAIRGGASAIQLRDKSSAGKTLLAVAREMQGLCTEKGALFIVNDALDIALAAGADGLHVGQEDLPVKEARRLLPLDKILGCSARTVAEALAARDDGADYIGVGAVFPTPSKPEAEVVGPARLEEIKRAVDLPLVAIGGINEDNLGQVIAAGADAVAVISAVLGAADVAAAARRLAERIGNEPAKSG